MDIQAPAGVINAEQMDMLIASAGVETVRAILEAFWRSNDELINALNGQLAEGDLTSAAASAHALKGSAANLGAMQLSELARAIEAACRDNDNASASQVLQKVGPDLDRTREAFDTLLHSHAA